MSNVNIEPQSWVTYILQPNTTGYCTAQNRNVIHKKTTQKEDFLKQCQMQTIQQKNKKQKTKNRRRRG